MGAFYSHDTKHLYFSTPVISYQAFSDALLSFKNMLSKNYNEMIY